MPSIRSELLAAGAAFAAIGATCQTGPENSAPTVVITRGPEAVVVTDTAGFTWQGSDPDGNLVGFRWWLDDTLEVNATADTCVTLEGLSLGEHEFYVQAEDDSGARSNAAVWSFWVEYDSSIAPRGTDTTLEIATWNIQNFPKQGDSTVNKLRAIITRLDLDVYAIQEIQDTAAFRRLVSGLAGYAGLFSQDSYGTFYLKTGLVYKQELVTVSGVHQLFWGNDSVTRPPLEMTVNAELNGQEFDFRLIVLHLKAGSSSEDQAERRATCRLLKEYIDQELETGTELDFVVVGDWNDRLDDPREWNVFQQFLDDSLDYRFLTWPLRSSTHSASHIGSGALIDHLMVTTDCLEEYGSGTTATLRLDDEFSRYEQVVSDHRPVVAYFPVFSR